MKLVSVSANNIGAEASGSNGDYVALNNGKSYYPLISSGSHSGYVIRTLQLSAYQNNGQIRIARVDGLNNILFEIIININAYNYLLLWQGFIYLPANVGLYIRSDINNKNADGSLIPESGINAYVSAIDQSNAIGAVI